MHWCNQSLWMHPNMFTCSLSPACSLSIVPPPPSSLCLYRRSLKNHHVTHHLTAKEVACSNAVVTMSKRATATSLATMPTISPPWRSTSWSHPSISEKNSDVGAGDGEHWVAGHGEGLARRHRHRKTTFRRLVAPLRLCLQRPTAMTVLMSSGSQLQSVPLPSSLLRVVTVGATKCARPLWKGWSPGLVGSSAEAWWMKSILVDMGGGVVWKRPAEGGKIADERLLEKEDWGERWELRSCESTPLICRCTENLSMWHP